MSLMGDLFVHYYGMDLPDRLGWKAIKCPEHGDKNASAQVNTDKGGWHCFTCDIKEDVYGLVMRMEGCDFRTALTFVEERFGSGHRPVSDRTARKPSGRLSARQGDLWQDSAAGTPRLRGGRG